MIEFESIPDTKAGIPYPKAGKYYLDLFALNNTFVL